jgi:hypothetical protein
MQGTKKKIVQNSEMASEEKMADKSFKVTAYCGSLRADNVPK